MRGEARRVVQLETRLGAGSSGLSSEIDCLHNVLLAELEALKVERDNDPSVWRPTVTSALRSLLLH
jgi:hypothetical protein